MRDNHTFAAIEPREVEAIIARVREIFEAPGGHCGTLFARWIPADVAIQALAIGLPEPYDRFPEAAVRQWAETLVALHAARTREETQL